MLTPNEVARWQRAIAERQELLHSHGLEFVLPWLTPEQIREEAEAKTIPLPPEGRMSFPKEVM